MNEDEPQPRVPSTDDGEPHVEVDYRPFIPSRRERLVIFLRHNRDHLITDAAILVAWIIGTASFFQWLGLPRWLHYLVLFIGIVVYAQLTPRWERPYRSGD